MKSGVASHILAVQYLKEPGLAPKGDVTINVVIDEEVSGHGTLDTVIRGYNADAGVSGETSDLAVQPACIGRIWFEIEILQASRPESRNATRASAASILATRSPRRSLISRPTSRHGDLSADRVRSIRYLASSAVFRPGLSERLPREPCSREA